MKLFSLFKKKESNWDKKISRKLVGHIRMEIKLNPQVCSLDEIPQGMGKFGLEKSNPIPIYGGPAIEFYLKKVRTQNGEKIKYKKIGFRKANNITMPIYEYEIMNVTDDKISSLYLSPFHWRTSRKAPEGFKLN